MYKDKNVDKEYHIKYYIKNRKNLINYQKQWESDNKDKRCIYQKKYKKRNKERLDEYNRKYCLNRYKNDIDYRLRVLLRNRINKMVKGKYKLGSSVKDLGCSVEDFKLYIEDKFKMGMDWSNYGYWVIDHIKPLASFNLSNKDEFLKAVHFTNLQPLWSKENAIKSDKYND